MKSNKEIAQEVEQTCAYVNKMFFLAMSSNSKELHKILNNFKDFKKTFPKIPSEDWGLYSDNKELPGLLDLYGYDGWLFEVKVKKRDRFKSENKNQEVKRNKFIYCQDFNEIIPKMLEFSKDVLEEDIIKFNRDQNEKK